MLFFSFKKYSDIVEPFKSLKFELVGHVMLTTYTHNHFLPKVLIKSQ